MGNFLNTHIQNFTLNPIRCLKHNSKSCTCCYELKELGIQKFNLKYNLCVGSYLVGSWFCSKCKKELFPRQIELIFEANLIKNNGLFWVCPNCNNDMEYNEND